MDYMGMAAQIAREEGLDPEIFVRMITQESGFDPDAVSDVGAVGMAQVMPETARDPGYGVAPLTDPTDPEASLRFGAQYLKAMLDKYNGDYGLALAAYNAGPQAVDSAGGIPNYRETKNYVSKILGGAASPAAGYSTGRPEGSLPSEDLMLGVPADGNMEELQPMIDLMMRGQPTAEQYASLQQLMEQNALASSSLRRPTERGVMSLPQARSTKTVMERMASQ